METTKELIFLFIGLATGIFLSIDLKRGCPRCGSPRRWLTHTRYEERDRLVCDRCGYEK